MPLALCAYICVSMRDSKEKEMFLAAVDPGRCKCGLAILDKEGKAYNLQVIHTKDLAQEMLSLRQVFPFSCVAVGNGTTSIQAREALALAMPEVIQEIVDEYNTTAEARQEYWHEHPLRGWKRFLPKGLLVPPEPLDGYAALLLGRRYLMLRKD